MIHFQPLGDEAAAGRRCPSRCGCPSSPTSYEGELVTVAWLVRVRQGSELAWDTRFTVTP